MVEEMKFEESSLAGYLVKNLGPLTEADPVILSKYVVAFLKEDKPLKELQKLCTDNLVEFLGNGAKSFTAELFQAIEDDSIVKEDEKFDAIQEPESCQPSLTEEIHHLKNSTKVENLSSSSEHTNDSEDQEVSDDVDDHNYKHRKRETQQSSCGNNVQEQHIRTPNRKRSKQYDNRHRLLDNDAHFSVIKKDCNPPSEGNISSKFDKNCYDLAPLLRPPSDLGQWTRFGQLPQYGAGVHVDLSTPAGHSSIGRGRGRGRGTVVWSQHDSRFNQDTVDFAPQLALQGPSHSRLFIGTGLPSFVSSQSASWERFGFIPGMSNMIMDPRNSLGLHGALPLTISPPSNLGMPLQLCRDYEERGFCLRGDMCPMEHGLNVVEDVQGALPSTISPPLNLGMPRQRCRDFEERGFCLRGDMCPMEHGLNRIVVQDVQSLSQFNFPVSIPSSHGLGMQVGSRPLPLVPSLSGLWADNISLANKSSRLGFFDDEAPPDEVPASSGGGDVDVYDPDQPLWNNDSPDTSAALLRLYSPNIDDEPSLVGDPTAHQSFRSNSFESESPSRRITSNIGSQNTNISVCGRIGSRNKLGSKASNKNVTGNLGDEMKENREEAINNSHASSQGKGGANMEIGLKSTTVQPTPRLHTDSGHRTKAFCTLYVNSIPKKSNTWEALISHFQKFGKVVDIYIPLNSGKAFVQFSKREEAKAALKSTNAVMGNRFIKLSWANHDMFPDGHSSGDNKSIQFPTAVMTSVPSQSSVANRGNVTFRVSDKTGSNITTVETPVLSSGPFKSLTIQAPKAAPPTQKKPKSLLLLEELRMKQENLAKKRDDFMRQLNKFEKQAIFSKKGIFTSEQAVKRQKVDTGTKAGKTAAPKSSDLDTLETDQAAEKTSCHHQMKSSEVRLLGLRRLQITR